MKREDILLQLETIFQDVLNNEIKLDESMTANDIDEWTSLAHTQIIYEIERHFDIKLPLTAIMTLRSVGQFVDVIENRGKCTS